MYESRKERFLRLADDAQAALVDAARDPAPVSGLTHGFYKSPARFSPVFASAAIQTFTQPGDLVLDPHVGGGTTLVEAIAAGREAVGVDISTLAEFVTGIKCTVFSEAELDTLERWAGRVAASVDIHKPSTSFSDYQEPRLLQASRSPFAAATPEGDRAIPRERDQARRATAGIFRPMRCIADCAMGA